jgi:flavoprotein hydroxylase
VTGPEAAADIADIADVAVVGYGPVGQVTALLLAARGHRVTAVERWPRPYPMPRATSFDGESARILAAAGIRPDQPDVGEPSRDYVWRTADGRTLFEVDVADPGRYGWPDVTAVYQPALEAALAARGERLPTLRVLRGHRVTGLDQDEAAGLVRLAVDGPRGGTLTARWVVGCDGANSFVRDATGITSTDLGFAGDWLSADVRLRRPRVFTPHNLQICDPARPRTAVSAGPGHRRWEFMRLPGEPLDTFGTEANAWRLLALFGIHPGDAVLERHTVYGFRARAADRWRAGRVLLAGDAAHVMPPFAGQGMCSGFRDAANLAWKLDLVLTGAAGEALLDTYGEERRGHVAHALAMSTHLARVISETDPAAARDRDTVMLAARERGVGATGLRSAVRPLTGGLVHRPGTPPAGDVVPQGTVTGAGRRGLFDDVVGTGRFTLLTTRPPGDLLDDAGRAFLAALGTRLVHVRPPGSPADAGEVTEVTDDDGVYLPYLAAAGARALLVRPDFHVFAAAPGPAALAAAVTDLRARLTGPAQQR